MMTLDSPVFTIFTATFNRAGTLTRVYEGLCSQTYRDFEWLIIDDGSTDATGEMVSRWRGEATFSIRYYWQENRGKHVAHNVALEKAQGEFFIVLDSDDSIVPDALERLLSLWNSVPLEQRVNFCGMAALCVDQHGELVGQALPEPMMDASILEMRFIHKRSQEFFGCYKTSIVKAYPFSEIDNARFIPEGVVWSQIGQKYKTRYANEPLRIYYTDNDASSLMRSNPAKLAASHSLWHRFTLNQEIPWFRFAPLHFLMSATHYVRFSFHNHKRILEQYFGLQNFLARLLWLLALPIGVAIFLRDNFRKYA